MTTAEKIAQSFHETYERLAPDHGYEPDGNFSSREIDRLTDFLTTQFPLPIGVPGPDDTPVDVAIRLLTDLAKRYEKLR